MSVLGAIFVSIGVLFGITGVNEARERDEERRRREAYNFSQRFATTSNTWSRPRPEARPRNSGFTATGAGSRASDASQTCISCQDDVPQETMLLLQDEFLRPLNRAPTCNHVWCHECLKGRFESVLKDRTLWPPACCNKVPFAELEILALNLLDKEQFETFRSKTEEYESKNPIYCPIKTCSAFIPVQTENNLFGRGFLGRPSSSRDNPRSVHCKKCRTLVCTQCKQLWHPASVACAKDEDRKMFDELVAREMWASCPACNQTIELAHGCNHMVCICKKEFCYVCKGDWRGTCPCPPWSRVKEQRNTTQRAATATFLARPPLIPVERAPPILPENLVNFHAENRRIELARRRAELLQRQREAEERRRTEEENRRRTEREEENRRRIALINQAREEALRRELQQRLTREREERERREKAELEERERQAKEQRRAELREVNRRRKAAERAELLERHQALAKEQREKTGLTEANRSFSERQASVDDGLRREISSRVELEKREKRQRELRELHEQHERQLQDAFEGRQKWAEERGTTIVKSVQEREQRLALGSAKQLTAEKSEKYKPRNRTIGLPTRRNQGRSQHDLESDDTNQPSATCRHPNRFWPQVNGRNTCSRCKVRLNKFLLQCPECEILACVGCSRELKRGY